MFHAGFVPIIFVCSLISFKLYRMALVDPPMGPLIDGYLNTCTYSPTNPFHDFICVIEPFFKELVGNEIGKSFLTGFGTAGAVMSTHLYIRSGQRGASRLFSPLILIAHSLAGQVFGAGIVGPCVVPTLLVLAKTFEPAHAPRKHRAPPPYAYTVTALTCQFLVFLLSMALTAIPPTSPNWVYANYAFQGFPLLFLPLVFFPSSDMQPVSIPTLSASVFTVLKYLYCPLWWISVAQGLNAYFRAGEPFSLPCYFMALDFGGFVLTFLGMYAVEAVAGDAPPAFGVAQVLGRLMAVGPASTMAAYFEAKERQSIEHAVATKKQS